MQKKKQLVVLLILSAISLVSLVLLIAFVAPNTQLPALRNLGVGESMLYIFFPLLFLFLFSTSSFVFKSTKHGALIALFGISYLLFRLNNLTHPFFFILLCALFLMLELLFTYRRR